MKPVLTAGSIAPVVAFCITLLTLFGPATQAAEYLKFAMMLLLFLCHVLQESALSYRGRPLGR
jgi:hypothetical protein